MEEADEGTDLVHISPPNGWGCALYVCERSGRLLRQNRVVNTPGLDPTGLSIRFHEFEQVGCATLPQRTSSEFAASALGKMESHVTHSSIEPAVDEALFSLDRSP